MRIRAEKILKYTDKIIPVIYDTVDSTNRVAAGLARESAKQGTVVIARNQTVGRGRLGRSFVSYDGGIYMSFVLRPDESADDALFITVAAAVAVSRAVERVIHKKCDIKWVNDIYINGKKVCGILTEGGINPKTQKLEYAILGIGINLFATKEKEFDSLQIAGTVFEKHRYFKEDIAARLIAETANEFFGFYGDLSSKKYIAEYQSRSLLDGKQISYQKDGKVFNATVIGVDDNARLLVKSGECVTALSTGEVQITSAENLFENKRG